MARLKRKVTKKVGSGLSSSTSQLVDDRTPPKRGWQKKFNRLSLNEIEVIVSIPELKLGSSEWDRLIPKIEMVEEFAKQMVIGMIKGTLKYETDHYSPHAWMLHLIEEQADVCNYVMLYKNRIEGGK